MYVTWFSFIIGLVLFGLGFLMVWKRRAFREYAGDLGTYFDLPGSSWLAWEVLGSALMMIGFLYGLGIFQLFMAKLLQGVVFPTIG